MLCRLPTDMRKSYDGLSSMVREHFGGEASDGRIFVFINRKQTQMKCLVFESGGYCLFGKRLEAGLFRAQHGQGEALTLSVTDFYALLEGVDIEIKRQRKRYKKC